MKFIFLILLLMGPSVGFAETTSGTFKDLVNARSEIEFMKLWEKLSVTEKSRAERLLLFRGFESNDIDQQAFFEFLKKTFGDERTEGEKTYQSTLKPEGVSWMLKVSLGPCLKSSSGNFFLKMNQAWGQSLAPRAKPVQERTWVDEVLEILCGYGYCLGEQARPEANQSQVPDVPVVKKEAIDPKVCPRLIEISFLIDTKTLSQESKKSKSVLKPERLWMGGTESLADYPRFEADILERLQKRFIYYRIAKDRKRGEGKSDLKESDYFAIVERRKTSEGSLVLGKYSKLSLYLLSQGVSARDLQNPCPKVKAFLSRFRESPSQDYLTTCEPLGALKNSKTRMAFALVPALSPGSDAEAVMMASYHTQIVRLVNFALQVMESVENRSASVENSENLNQKFSDTISFQKIESYVGRGLFSRLASQIDQSRRGSFEESKFDLEAEIAKSVISLFEKGDRTLITREKENLLNLREIFVTLSAQLKEMKNTSSQLGNDIARTQSQIEKQNTLVEGLLSEITRRETP
jgi:hypothetical protein